ncbi:lyase family protein [Devosia sp. SL43]|uniref:lyase family protein n=1 Tax=Devosia sp. SL43 TaxID=2806348 RepID=UPI001EFF0552|nr:lyase family protein [Devosia sp. SL43]UJW84864.1 adenylosuccinate lyase family protein [Devosia sp. SL43]
MFQSVITRHWFAPEAVAIWTDASTVQAWLYVEAALAQAQGELGLIPAAVVPAIVAACRAEKMDFGRLSADIAHAQHPFVPVLKQVEQLAGEPAAGYLHWGATTQNIFDTATALQMRRTHRLTVTALSGLEQSLALLARTHRDTLQVGRTHGQHALPMTFGYKVLAWLDEIRRARTRLEQRIDGSFPVNLGGAIGTFAAMGDKGPAVAAAVASRLGLEAAELPLRSSFDRPADYLAALALLAQVADKIAHDVVFLQRTEVGEVAEAFHDGKVGSSTMAQKRNPSTALLLISLCRLLTARVPLATWSMPRMDEGDSSATNVTDIVVPEIAILGVSIATTLAGLCDGLVVHADRMAANLELTRGQILSEAIMMRLSDQMGRHHAHHALYESTQVATAENRTLSEVMAKVHPQAGHVAAGIRVDTYLGAIGALTDKLAPDTAD